MRFPRGHLQADSKPTSSNLKQTCCHFQPLKVNTWPAIFSLRTYGPLQVSKGILKHTKVICFKSILKLYVLYALGYLGATWGDLLEGSEVAWGDLKYNNSDLKYNNFVIAIYFYICFVILL